MIEFTRRGRAGSRRFKDNEGDPHKKKRQNKREHQHQRQQRPAGKPPRGRRRRRSLAVAGAGAGYGQPLYPRRGYVEPHLPPQQKRDQLLRSFINAIFRQRGDDRL